MGDARDRKGPCPCGSGKRYKSCCWAKDSASGPGGRARDLRSRCEAFVAALAEWSRRRGEDWVVRALERLEVEDRELAGYLPAMWAAFHAAREGRSAARDFLDDPGSGLAPELRAVGEAELESWVGLWKVEAVGRGLSIDVRDLLSGEPRHVIDRVASRTLDPGTLVCARVVCLDGIAIFSGIHLASLPSAPGATVADEIAGEVRRLLEGEGLGDWTPRGLARDEAGRRLIEIWGEIVASAAGLTRDGLVESGDDELPAAGVP